MIDESGGNFYVIPIEVVGKEANLYYSSNHMNKLSAFIKKETNYYLSHVSLLL